MKSVTDTILALESDALERWNAGDPDGYLALYDTDISYLDPTLRERIDGLENMTGYYEMARGKSRVTSYTMIDPLVQTISENSAVLSYNLHQVTPDRSYMWHCTQVYRKRDDGRWKISHNHWSLIMPIE